MQGQKWHHILKPRIYSKIGFGYQRSDMYVYVCIFIWIKHKGYNARDHIHQDISLVHCADPGPFP